MKLGEISRLSYQLKYMWNKKVCMTTEHNFLTVISKDVALLYQTAANLLRCNFRFHSNAITNIFSNWVIWRENDWSWPYSKVDQVMNIIPRSSAKNITFCWFRRMCTLFLCRLLWDVRLRYVTKINWPRRPGRKLYRVHYWDDNWGCHLLRHCGTKVLRF